MAQALSSNFGRDQLPDATLPQLCTADELQRAHQWGLAMRLGQRLSGGVASVLRRTRLSTKPGAVRLDVRAGEEALIGEAVKRRLARVAETLGCKAEVGTFR
jgi:exopolyphosphatase/guanosine-5'-triphosphate,3'-diphosphate pyrophosphatase